MHWNAPSWWFVKKSTPTFTTIAAPKVEAEYYSHLAVTFKPDGKHILSWRAPLGKVKDITKMNITKPWSNFKKWFHTNPESTCYTMKYDIGEHTFKREDILSYNVFYTKS